MHSLHCRLPRNACVMPTNARKMSHIAPRLALVRAEPQVKEPGTAPVSAEDNIADNLNSAETPNVEQKKIKTAGAQMMQRAADAAGVSLGPIGLTIGSDLRASDSDSDIEPSTPLQSIATFSTEEWRQKFEQNGRVDLWLQEEFNAASRLVGGRTVHFGGVAGYKSGEGATMSDAPRHKVKIFNHFVDQEIEVEVPEDRYILWEAEDQGLLLPYACRMGCCTACAVKVKEGEMYQPQSLGISKELKDQGYALMCVGFPLTDLVLETVDEDEIYELQFGKNFEAQATDKNANSVMRDDFAIELALLDE